MATTKSEVKETSNPFTKRYAPNTRYTLGAFKEQTIVPVRIDSFGESVVDKESYRLSLTSKRGAIGYGSATVGRYMFENGKYNPDSDFSYIMRKDVSIVEIDKYIERKEAELQMADKNLAEQIQYEIDQAKAQKDLVKEQKNVDNSSNE